MSVAPEREAWITGIGLVTALGEGLDAHWAALNGGKDEWLKLDSQTYAPYQVHPAAAFDVVKQIPDRGDRRQMEAWQRLGTYAAGLALDDAGVKGQDDLLKRMHMIVAAGGGERDYAVDGQILSGLETTNTPGPFLNERLMNDLRPTLFLAQLSNLLAGNISIVHGVVGSSRTFMGEEMAGVDAVRVALARCHAGQGDLFLAGGAYSAERPDGIMHFELGHMNWAKPWAPVWERPAEGGGTILGSIGAFLVIEAREHAEKRGAKPIARLASVTSDRTARKPGQAEHSLAVQWNLISPGLIPGATVVVSGATGIAEPVAIERDLLDQRRVPTRATGSVIGHGVEAAFPANVALAAMMVSKGQAIPPVGGSANEAGMTRKVKQAVVTSVGHWRGEGMGLVEAI
ncbi:beta-ketoacyl-ACP synthase [Phreatobacter aquaticus]|uniref:Beta-ketoacyl-ACP synthase n=1 Tax=Phreatobacter aquaticus TaxID=2570229 RepID=A0A4D7QSI4_9HYPH|nr:beta-ketoacyl-ACP synthase [Phreatobacter aquaticus]QCK88194.1 beta-ketoacyl-ACP synthase [Phreatobacter aquaticus]